MKNKSRFRNAFTYLFLIVFGAIILFPILLALITSFKSADESRVMTLSLPSKWMFENYKIVFEEADVLRSAWNGIIISFVSMVFILIFASMAAFIVNRRKSRFAGFCFAFLISGLIAPLAIIPEIRILQKLGLMGSTVTIIIVHIATKIPFVFFLLSGFMSSIPKSLDEATFVDGGNAFRVYSQVILPLLKPAIFTTIALNFIGIWNDFQFSLYFIPNTKQYTMPLMVQKFFGYHTADMHLICAHMVLTAIPVLVVYLISQKYIISGMTDGSVKG